MATSDKFKNKRVKELDAVAPRREESIDEKVQALDNLFAKFGTTPPASTKPKSNVQTHVPHAQTVNNTSVPTRSMGAQVEIYSNFGGGTILVNGKNERLPYLVPDAQTLMHLRNSFEIDTAHAVLRTRRI